MISTMEGSVILLMVSFAVLIVGFAFILADKNDKT